MLSQTGSLEKCSAAALGTMLWLWQVLLGALLAKDTSMFFASTKLKVLNDCDMLVVADMAGIRTWASGICK